MLLVLAGGISTASSAEEVQDFWIVGDIPGTDWTTATNDWKMSTTDEEGNIYTLTVSNVTLEADKTYYFKARNTQSGWNGATSYGYNGENQSYYVNPGKGGTYDLFFVLNRSEAKVSLIILDNLQLKGFLGSWDGINMTKVGDYTYQYTVNLSTTQESQSFKFYVDVPGHCTDQSDYWIGKDKVDLYRFEGVEPLSEIIISSLGIRLKDIASLLLLLSGHHAQTSVIIGMSQLLLLKPAKVSIRYCMIIHIFGLMFMLIITQMIRTGMRFGLESKLQRLMVCIHTSIL